MEPLACIVAIAVGVSLLVICYFIIKQASQGSSFEEAYGQSALKLLTTDKPVNNKGKKKPKKKAERDVVRNGSEASDQTVEETAALQADDIASNAFVEEKALKQNGKKSKKGKKSEGSDKSGSSAIDDQFEIISNDIEMPKGQPKPRKTRSTPLDWNAVLDTLYGTPGIDTDCLEFLKKVPQDAERSVSKLRDSETKLREQNRELRSDLDQLQRALDDANFEVGKQDSLQQALKSAEQKHEMFVASVSPKLAEHAQFAETIRSLRAEKLALLKTQNEIAEKMKFEVQGAIQQSEKAGNEKVQLLEKQLQKSRDDLRRKEEEARQTVIHLNDAKLRVEVERNELIEACKLSKNSILNLREEINSHEQVFANLSAANEDLHRQLSIFGSEFNPLKEQNASLKNQLQEIQGKFAEGNNRSSDVENLLKQQVLDAEKRLQATQARLSDTEKLVANMRSEISSALGREEAMKGTLKVLVATKDDCTTQLASLRTSLEKTIDLKERAEREVDQLRASAKAVKQSNTSQPTISKSEEEWNQRCETLRSRNAKLMEHVQGMEAQLKAAPREAEHPSEKTVGFLQYDVLNTVFSHVAPLKPPVSDEQLKVWLTSAIAQDNKSNEYSSVKQLTERNHELEEVLRVLIPKIDELESAIAKME